IAGAVAVADDCLSQLDILHSTLVPGLTLDADRNPVTPNEPSVTVVAPSSSLQLRLDHSISGPLRLPVDVVGFTARDSIIESPIRDKPAQITPALLSGSLAAFPSLTPAKPKLSVTIGNDGPYIATL